jgi:hypothetical protein
MPTQNYHCPRHESIRGGRGIAPLILNLWKQMEKSCQFPAALLPETNPGAY